MSPKPCILVIEDDAHIQALICACLQPAGCIVHVAQNGREGLFKAIELQPSAIILDINMPGIDGFGFLHERTKLQPPSQQAPVLVLSARHAGDDVRRAISLGAKDYLAKPFNAAQLLSRITRLLRPSLRQPTAPPAAPAAAPPPKPSADPNEILL